MGLNSYIMEIRKALGDRRPPYQYIRTVRGHGYRFTAAVTTEDYTPPNRMSPLGGEPPGPATRCAPIVGQEAELAQLACWFARVQNGERHLVFVTGEPGIGKTTLIDTWLAHLAGETPIWIARGQCVEQLGAQEPYRPVLEALGRLGRGPSGKELVALLRAQAPTWLAQMPGLVPAGDLEALQRRLGGATRERMLRELAEVIDALTAQQTLVLVLEDLHWSDPSTLDLLAVLARHRDPARLLILGTYRPAEVRPRAHPLATVLHELRLHGHSVELPVTLLTEDAIAAYLTSRLRDLPRVAVLTRLVHQHTEGHPLFMVTLVEAWLTQGVLREYDGTWPLPVEVKTLHGRVPDSLRQMIAGQLDRLSGEEQRVLEAASVAGVEFSAAAVAVGLGQAVEQVDDACAALALHGQWLRAVGEWSWPDGTVAGGYRFGHALYQHVLYSRVSAARRVQLHQHIGARKEVGYGTEAGARAAELAVHFARGRVYPRAVQYLRQAGDNAFARSTYGEAMTCYEHALETVSQLPESRTTREQAIDLRLSLRNVLWTMGNLGRLFVTLQEAEGLAEALGDQHRLGWVSVYLLAHFAQVCDTDRALAAGQRALAIATALGDMSLTVVAQHYLGGVYRSLGDYRQAVECFQTNVAYLDSAPGQESHGLPGLAAVFARSHLVVAMAECGTFAEGRGPAAEEVQMAEAAHHSYSRVMAWWAVL